MEENKDFKFEDKHTYSLVSILFFAPWVYFLLNWKNDNNISDEDKQFIMWYIRYWLIILWLLIFSLIIYIVSISINLYVYFFTWLSSLIATIAVLMIIAWFFLIFQDKQIFQSKIDIVDIKYKKINVNSIDIAFYFLPINNFHIWYNNPDINKYWWVKESFLWWYLWAVFTIITLNIPLSLVLLSLIFVRTVSLVFNIDIIPDKYKEKIDKLYDTNPEEIFSYIKSMIIFFYKKIKDTDTNKKEYFVDLEKYKNEYWYILNIDKYDKENIIKYKDIFLQYLIAFVFALVLSNIIYINTIIKFNSISNILYLWYFFVIIRYLYMIYKKKIINIPIFKEIVDLINLVADFINKNKK